MNWFEEFWAMCESFLSGAGLNIMTALTFLMLGIVIIKIVSKLMKKALLRSPVENSLVTFIISIANFAMYIILIVTVAVVLGIPMTSFIAISTALGLAVSLALQGSLSNMANGVVIISTKPFKEGDFIEVGSVSGKVKAIRMLNTKLVTADNKVILIPNTTIINSNVINYSSNVTRRVEWVFGVAYSEDIDRVKDIILEIITEHNSILNVPEPMVRLGEHAASSLNIFVKAWVPASSYWDVFFDINEEVLRRFKAMGVEIPFPQMDVHLKDAYRLKESAGGDK